MFDEISKWRIILASRSPRRKLLMEGMGISFEVLVKETDEIYPAELKAATIAEYLSKKKALAFQEFVNENNNSIIIAADTIVWFRNQVLGKPTDKEDAVNILNLLSGEMHFVYTGITLLKRGFLHTFYSESKVFFKKFNSNEIQYYVENYKPYDKAGAYGAQEWLGYIGIERIEGSYFNVMGFPTRLVWEELQKFCLLK